jgi:hypothetical protein
MATISFKGRHFQRDMILQSMRWWYCQLKSNWADFLPRASNLNAEQSMRDEFVYCLIFGQIHLT